MASQRVGVGGSPIEPRLSNGPLRAQSKKVRKVKVSCLQKILETVTTDEGKEGKNTKVGKRRKRYVK